jgi:acetyl esterase/lipase
MSGGRRFALLLVTVAALSGEALVARQTAPAAFGESLAEALRTHGIDVRFTEYPGHNHDTTPAAATPDIFAFFAAHARR